MPIETFVYVFYAISNVKNYHACIFTNKGVAKIGHTRFLNLHIEPRLIKFFKVSNLLPRQTEEILQNEQTRN